MSDLARDAAWLRKLADLIGPLKDERALVRLREIAGRLDGVAVLGPDVAVELARLRKAVRKFDEQAAHGMPHVSYRDEVLMAAFKVGRR